MPYISCDLMHKFKECTFS